MSAGPVRVVVVDDHPIVRAGLRGLLDADPRVDVVGEAASGEAALAVVRRQVTTSGVDLVLMDLSLGEGMSGIEATRRIVAEHPGVRVLVVTAFDADADLVGALEAGATGYVLKDSPTADLVGAAVSAAAGETVLSPEVQARLVRRTVAPTQALSARETEIVALLAEGLTNRAIARRLFISESTVKTHLAHLNDKLGVDNRTAAVAEARRRRLIR